MGDIFGVFDLHTITLTIDPFSMILLALYWQLTLEFRAHSRKDDERHVQNVGLLARISEKLGIKTEGV
jgi:hypothetical protein